MNIQDDLKETGKIEGNDGTGIVYAERDNAGVLMFYFKSTGKVFRPVSLNEITGIIWISYHEVKEIRPEYTQELWKIKNSVWVTFRREGSPCLKFMHTVTGGEVVLNDWYLKDEIIHNKNGWTRLYPPVEDENVERIEIKKVTFDRIQGANGAEYMSIISTSCEAPSLDIFKGKSGKMILEISKDK